MSKPPKLEQPNLLNQPAPYDFVKLQNILNALDFLRNEASEAGCEDIRIMIDSTFNMVLASYYLVLRHSAAEKYSGISMKAN